MAKLELQTDRLEDRDSLKDVPQYDLWEMRREPIPWDKVVKVTHSVNCAYNIACTNNAYVWDGVVLREEQAANYEPLNDPDCPDLNPKGCQKGLCFVQRTYDPARIKRPLKRTGERGEGKWQAISWEQALDEIADTMLDVMVTDGPKAITNMAGTGGLGSQEAGGVNPLGVWTRNMGIPMNIVNHEVGDEHQGCWETFGACWFGSSADNWYYSDLFLLWGGNPSYTHTSVYHYLTEARYNGTKIISICPDYNPSAICADEWVSLRMGTDAALALGMCQVLIEEGLYKRDFVVEQTDLPLLVREDNRKYLRESDLKRGGRDYVFYVYDRKGGKVVEAPSKSLALDGLDPALEGEYEAQTLRGPVKLRPAFAMLKERLDKEYRPEQASDVCGVSAETIRRLAREIAAAKAVQNIPEYNSGKYYHGNLMERAVIYVFLLTGNIGRVGAAYNSINGAFTAEHALGAMTQRSQDMLKGAVNHPRYSEWRERGFTDARIIRALMREMTAGGSSAVSTFFYFHAGLLDLSKKYNSWDPDLKRPLNEYVEEGLEAATRPVLPAVGKDPKVIFAWGGDAIRRVRGNQYVINTLLPKAKLFFCVDWRWNPTAAYADYVLPCTAWYERSANFLFSMQTTPIAHFGFKAVEPLYESKTDWWIGVSLTRRLAEKARERGLDVVKDPATGEEFKISQADAVVTANDLYTEDDHEDAVRDSFLSTTNIEQMSWEEIQEKGHTYFTHSGFTGQSTDFAADIMPRDPVTPLTYHVQRKQPYQTLTGRAQFYIDHDWFLELGEEFAWHKESIKAGGDYPLQITGGHARWSAQASWADSPLMLQLQRGEPIMFMSVTDAEARGINDGDFVEAHNDVGRFQIMVAVAPAVRPGQVIIYHQWDNNQFRGWRHFQQTMPTPFNPVEWSPATQYTYPNLASGGATGDPGHSDRDSRVEVRKV